MARYAKEHKQETRRRIIETAGRRFKRDGIDGSGVATLMSDAGLTNGAFYAHFTSKDDLVAHAVADQLHTQYADLCAQAAPGFTGLEQMVRQYLSPEHRDNPDGLCPSAALLDEIGRSPKAVKQAYTTNVLVLIDEIAARFTPADPASARVKALSLLGQLAGTLQLSRALTDPELSDQLLEQGVQNALALIGTDQHS
ncbi:TetR/AcrR family transcriptional regulator [Streptomyces sp. NY05-11A]|uniref:TetR/AcrR family transcriptional regulator n=1 Tax=Streptomyces soliscabiei TaxID=588897 RepID=UPI0029BBF65A|nr:TetR/AcrR family transcriptional regulator [Streptomyces sp. NY05-11A]MDX2682144.1 TetR/AcrR family transcriptional regulator [Streptomyces sp. NY05-11A]